MAEVRCVSGATCYTTLAGDKPSFFELCLPITYRRQDATTLCGLIGAFGASSVVTFASPKAIRRRSRQGVSLILNRGASGNSIDPFVIPDLLGQFVNHSIFDEAHMIHTACNHVFDDNREGLAHRKLQDIRGH